MVYVAGLVAYDGTTFHGFQIQRKHWTIQAALENALFLCCGEQVRIHGSGRTDTGVHARGQVVAASVPWRHSLVDLQRAWNANLPETIVIHSLVEAPQAFHPRFSAEARIYRYTVYDINPIAKTKFQPMEMRAIPKHLPLTDRFSLFVPFSLDLESMNMAAKRLIGEHDYHTFGQPPQGKNTVREIFEAEWVETISNLQKYGDNINRCLTFTIKANGFLRHMVRNIVGTLLVIGKREWSATYIDDLLIARDRSRCAPPASPQGLVLECVTYPNEVDPWINKTG